MGLGGMSISTRSGLKEYFELTANGFGFRIGDVAGIISVTLPARSFWRLGLTVVGGGEFAIIIAAFLIAMLFVRFAIVRPVKRLTEASHQSACQPECGPHRPAQS
jgi:hypothetical protein